jgi:hypothetical protein
LVELNCFSQEVPQSVSNKAIYDFLDELAAKHVITINSAVKPYSRLFISRVLIEAAEKKELLTTRQQKELEFYLKDFIKEDGASGVGLRASGKEQRRNGTLRRDLFYYSDSSFSITVNPILGGEIFSNSAGKATYMRNGAEARGYAGRWGFYASLRDNHEKPLIGSASYLNPRTAGHIKNGNDWSDMQGGVTYS